jgi:hypothetical protein
MKVNREDTERSIYPKTHISDENIEKVWNHVCVDRPKKIKQAYYIERLKKFHRSVQRKSLNLGPSKWFLHYNNTPTHQTLSVKMFRDWYTPFLSVGSQ